jgi:hypothetical protein
VPFYMVMDILRVEQQSSTYSHIIVTTKVSESNNTMKIPPEEPLGGAEPLRQSSTISSEDSQVKSGDVCTVATVRERMLDMFPVDEDELDWLLQGYATYSKSQDRSMMPLSAIVESGNCLIVCDEHIESLHRIEQELVPESSTILQQALNSAFVVSSGEDDDIKEWKFLEAIMSLVGRRGSRCLLDTLYNVVGATQETPQVEASSLIDLVYRLVQASQNLKDGEARSRRSPPKTLVESLTERAKGGIISRAAWIDWVQAIAPQAYQALSTFCHFALFRPSHPFRRNCQPLALPYLEQECAIFQDPCDPISVSLGLLSSNLGGRWKRLFSNDFDGCSFSTFQKSLLGYQGSTLILTQTMKGDIFGFYTACPWKTGNTWFGQEDESFIFGIKPTLQFFYAEGSKPYNMYLNNSTTTRSDILKGLGVGGIAASTPRIHITTTLEQCKAGANDSAYTCGPLLSDGDVFFDMDILEVWTVSSSEEKFVQNVQKGHAQEQIREGRRIQAAQVDRKQFLDDFQTGAYGSSLFKHREESRGKHSFCAHDDGVRGYYVEDHPPTPKEGGTQTITTSEAAS